MLESKVQFSLARFSKLLMPVVNQEALATIMTNMAAMLVVMVIMTKKESRRKEEV